MVKFEVTDHNMSIHHVGEIERHVCSLITQILGSCRQFLTSLKYNVHSKLIFGAFFRKKTFSRGGWDCSMYLRNFRRGGEVKKPHENGKSWGFGGGGPM